MRVKVCDGVGVCVLQGVIEIHIMLVSREENLLLYDSCKEVKRRSRKCFDVTFTLGPRSHLTSHQQVNWI